MILNLDVWLVGWNGEDNSCPLPVETQSQEQWLGDWSIKYPYRNSLELWTKIYLLGDRQALAQNMKHQLADLFTESCEQQTHESWCKENALTISKAMWTRRLTSNLVPLLWSKRNKLPLQLTRKDGMGKGTKNSNVRVIIISLGRWHKVFKTYHQTNPSKNKKKTFMHLSTQEEYLQA
jgi:hypothetical protein